MRTRWGAGARRAHQPFCVTPMVHQLQPIPGAKHYSIQTSAQRVALASRCQAASSWTNGGETSRRRHFRAASRESRAARQTADVVDEIRLPSMSHRSFGTEPESDEPLRLTPPFSSPWAARGKSAPAPSLCHSEPPRDFAAEAATTAQGDHSAGMRPSAAKNSVSSSVLTVVVTNRGATLGFVSSSIREERAGMRMVRASGV